MPASAIPKPEPSVLIQVGTAPLHCSGYQTLPQHEQTRGTRETAVLSISLFNGTARLACQRLPIANSATTTVVS